MGKSGERSNDQRSHLFNETFKEYSVQIIDPSENTLSQVTHLGRRRVFKCNPMVKTMNYRVSRKAQMNPCDSKADVSLAANAFTDGKACNKFSDHANRKYEYNCVDLRYDGDDCSLSNFGVPNS